MRTRLLPLDDSDKKHSTAILLTLTAEEALQILLTMTVEDDSPAAARAFRGALGIISSAKHVGVRYQLSRLDMVNTDGRMEA